MDDGEASDPGLSQEEDGVLIPIVSKSNVSWRFTLFDGVNSTEVLDITRVQSRFTYLHHLEHGVSSTVKEMASRQKQQDEEGRQRVPHPLVTAH